MAGSASDFNFTDQEAELFAQAVNAGKGYEEATKAVKDYIDALQEQEVREKVLQKLSQQRSREFVKQEREKYRAADALRRQRDREQARSLQEELKARTSLDRQRSRAYMQQERFARRTAAVFGIAGIAGIIKAEQAVHRLRDAGLENTVEANRQALAYTLLGREIAGIFMPATNLARNATMAATSALSGLSNQGQNVAFVLSTIGITTASATAAWILLVKTGVQLTGMLGFIARWLPLLGLAGGVLGGLAILFLNTESGAKLLNTALQRGVDILNEMGKAVDVLQGKFGNNGIWDKETTALAVSLAKLAELAGIVPKGTAKAVIQEHNAAVANFKNTPPNRPTPGEFKFENIGDAFERAQLAAAKLSGGKNDIPGQQLKELQEINKKTVPGKAAPNGANF